MRQHAQSYLWPKADDSQLHEVLLRSAMVTCKQLAKDLPLHSEDVAHADHEADFLAFKSCRTADELGMSLHERQPREDLSPAVPATLTANCMSIVY